MDSNLEFTTGAVQKLMILDQLKLGNAAYKNWAYLKIDVVPFHKIRRHDRYFDGRWLCVENFSRLKVGNAILNTAIISPDRHPRPVPLNQFPVDLERKSLYLLDKNAPLFSVPLDITRFMAIISYT